MAHTASRCLGIVHVPKSAGTALRNALAAIPGVYGGPLYFDHAHFGSERLVAGVPSPNADAIADVNELADVVETHRAVIGHYSAATLMEAGCTSLAVLLREPRSRLLSLYRFWEGQSSEERASWGLWADELVARADLPLREFLTSSTVRPAIDNAVRRQLTGGRTPGPIRRRTRRFRRPGGATVCGPIEVAAWSDRADAFVSKVCALIGADERPKLARSNVTEVRGEAQVIDRDTLRLLDHLTRGDSALLAQLMRDGVLEHRSTAQLDEDFRQTLSRLSFRMSA